MDHTDMEDFFKGLEARKDPDRLIRHDMKIALQHINQDDESMIITFIKMSKVSLKMLDDPSPEAVRLHEALWVL